MRVTHSAVIGPRPPRSMKIRTAALAPLGERVAIPHARESRVRGLLPLFSKQARTRLGAQVRGWGLRLLMLALAAWWPQGASADGGTRVRTEVASPSRVAALYAQLPLTFEINQGQTDPRVKYLARGP